MKSGGQFQVTIVLFLKKSSRSTVGKEALCVTEAVLTLRERLKSLSQAEDAVPSQPLHRMSHLGTVKDRITNLKSYPVFVVENLVTSSWQYNHYVFNAGNVSTKI
jgi:hypothetical protein